MFIDFFVVFFFKQKTAYDMRISDLSSDVCSSDLDLLRKYLDGHCTPEEKGLLESWYLRYKRRDLAELTGDEKQRSLEKIRASLSGGQPKIGRASCRERVCQYETIPVDAGQSEKTFKSHK